MKPSLLFYTLFITNILFGQGVDTLTLDYCYDHAVSYYPLAQQEALHQAANEIAIKKINSNFQPQVDFNGRASYQSDVVQVDVTVPPIEIPPPIDMTIYPDPLEAPRPPYDQYDFSLDVNQVIFDGTVNKKQKMVEATNLSINQQQLKVELYKLKEQINNVFFQIILLQENKKLLLLHKENLSKKLQEVESRLKYGVILESNRDILKAEIIGIEQKLIEIDVNKTAGINILGELISEKIPQNIYLLLPEVDVDINTFNNSRPESGLLSLQKEKISATKDLLTAKWNPRLMGFGRFGYGSPGLNMLSPDWDTYYIVGARLSWNLWNGNKNKKEKQILDIQSRIIDTQLETLDKGVKIESERDVAEILKYQRIIEKDHEIIELRSRIARSASAQLDNGIITSTEYIDNLNQETRAKLELQTHKVQLVNAQINYLGTQGNL